MNSFNHIHYCVCLSYLKKIIFSKIQHYQSFFRKNIISIVTITALDFRCKHFNLILQRGPCANYLLIVYCMINTQNTATP